MDLRQYTADSLPESRKTLITLQCLVVIGTSYLSLFSRGQVEEDPRVLALITVLLISILALQRIPEAVFGYRYFPHALVIVDTVLVTMGIGLNRETPWDLFLLFFFVLFIVGIGESLIQIVMGCLIISTIFVVLALLQGANHSLLEADLLLRIPFVFGVSILYGYLAEQVKREKKRAEQSEETEKLKRRLVSALAHDIKNPLGVISGYAEIVASRLERLPEGKENLESLQSIQDSTQRVVKLVTGFLDASKAEAGKLEVVQRPVDLNLLIRQVGQQQMGDLRKKNLSLSVDLDDHLPEIMGDEGQLDRVLWNLVGNAAKFTPMGGKITVMTRLENGHACVSVKDTGMGIPQDELPLLFAEFRRLKGTAKIEGTGLGLFIVKTIVEAHGGAVAVESEEGRGTTFSVHFPIRP